MANADDQPPSSSAFTQPLIEPSSFDLVLVGTGLPESLLAAAASAIGKTVLHLDPNPFYGSHFTSLSPNSLISFLQQKSPTLPVASPFSSSSHKFVPLAAGSLYTDVEIHGQVPDQSKGCFMLDVSGPRVLYCADKMVDVMLRSGASHHVEFKSVDGFFFYWDGKLAAVPDSREAIFKDKTLTLTEKTQMTRFLKLVKGHFASLQGADGEGRIADEDLSTPFAEFLDKQKLSKKIKAIVLYAIAMAEYDQDNSDSCKRLIKTEEALESLALYSSSLVSIPNAVGAFLYPIYGQGELPQAFCRCAAVKGAIYVLRMPVAGLLVSKEKGLCEGIKLASGQDIYCSHLVVDPSLRAASSDLTDPVTGSFTALKLMESRSSSEVANQVARMVCIIRHPIKSDFSNVLVIFPPKSLHPDQTMTIRALQLSSNLAVSPPDLFILYLSAACGNSDLGKEYGYLRAALDAICQRPDIAESENVEKTSAEVSEEPQQTVLWSALYTQEFTHVSHDPFLSCSMLDSNLDYRSTLETTIELFRKMYPQHEFIPQNLANEETYGDESLEE